MILATCPPDLQELAAGIVRNEYLHVVKSSKIHRLMPNVTQKFMRVLEQDKPDTLLKLISEDLSKPKGKTIVFCKVLFIVNPRQNNI